MRPKVKTHRRTGDIGELVRVDTRENGRIIILRD